MPALTKVVVLHNAVGEGASADERDVLCQVDAVSFALSRLGYSAEALPVTLDLQFAKEALFRLRPALVFNLVESLGGSDRLMHFVPSLLEVLGIPFTGASATAVLLSNEKLLSKRQLVQADLPTPAWVEQVSGGLMFCPAELNGPRRISATSNGSGCYIVKVAGEHASLGMDDSSVVKAAAAEDLLEAIQECSRRLRRTCFAEEFIAGREFNLSLLEEPDGPRVLPPAEIDFSSYPAEKPRIVGYQAKWKEDSFEYLNTPRKFDFSASDQPLFEHLSTLALECWRQFEMRGYARVDFRVDQANQPWILEVNANPCLSPDAGFAAALAQAGIPYEVAIQQVVDAMLRRTGCLSEHSLMGGR